MPYVECEMVRVSLTTNCPTRMRDLLMKVTIFAYIVCQVVCSG